MAAEFELHILTPERQFFSGQVESLTLSSVDGRLGIMAGHLPMVAPVEIGELELTVGGRQKKAFNSEGFIEVLHNRVLLFVQACEWPEEIDANRAARAVELEREHLRQKQSIVEYKAAKLALARAMERLRISGQNINFK